MHFGVYYLPSVAVVYLIDVKHMVPVGGADFAVVENMEPVGDGLKVEGHGMGDAVVTVGSEHSNY
jgi:hypothetical protein